MASDPVTLHPVDRDTLDHALADAARLLVFIERQTQAYGSKGWLASLKAAQERIGQALCVLDPSRVERDFAAVVTELVEKARARARLTAG